MYYVCDFLLAKSVSNTNILYQKHLTVCTNRTSGQLFLLVSSQAFMTTRHLTVHNINVHENRNENKTQYTKYIKHQAAETEEAE